jgi:alanyl-tRNA synthetase
MERLLYQKDTYLTQIQSTVVDIQKDEKGMYVVLDQTIFYPQGGGQPSDQGIMIQNDVPIAITFVRQIENEVRHYTADLVNDQWIGLHVLCQIDAERRLLNARYHTAAHLLGNIAEIEYPSLKAVKGHAFPGESYVEFLGCEEINATSIHEHLKTAIEERLTTQTFELSADDFESQFYKLPYHIPRDKIFRAMRIGIYAPVPCGGTHLKNIQEIGAMTIRKVNRKNGITRISYGVTSTTPPLKGEA